MTRTLLTVAAFSCLSGILLADDTAKKEVAPAPRAGVDLTGYHTTKDLVKADPKTFRIDGATATIGYLGISLNDDKSGRPVVEAIEADSPADTVTVKVGDIVEAINGDVVKTGAAAREKLRGKFAGDTLKLRLLRDGQSFDVSTKLKALSKPMKAATADRPLLGVQVVVPKTGSGVEIASVTTGGSADKAGLKTGDVIVKVGAVALEGEAALRDALVDNKAGDVVTLFIKRDNKDLELKATLTTESARTTGGWDDRLPTNFSKPVYKLALIGVEYPDIKHNEKISGKDWETQLFSVGTYTGKNATGQAVFGSLADYYKELSYDKLKVEGSFIDWVEVGKKKMDYNLGSSTQAADKSKYFTEVVDKLIAKRGKDCLKDYDGIFFVFAGDSVQTSRGGLYWPHRATFSHERKRWSYFIVPEQRRGSMTDISVICHEFGHMLGLPDLYARPENPGSEGVGVWDAMSNQLGNGRPQHFSAWSKEQMGWLKPILVDPRVKQKIVLAPVEDSPTECLKIPVRADGSEYFLLENRQRKGWDKMLPAEGLLVWRVMPANRGTQQVYLEESHGVEGPSGPRVFSGAVPFPSPANAAFTPFTTPSSKSQLGGGFDVYVTNIRRLSDGRVALHVGYEFQ